MEKKYAMQDPRFIQIKRNLKMRSKNELIFLLFQTHTYLEQYKNGYLELTEKIKELTKEQSNESSTKDESNVIESSPKSEGVVNE